MKKIMVMGAGIYQVPLINKIKALGYQALVVSPYGNYPGIKIASVHIDQDTRNIDLILEEAIKHNVDAILTTGTDVAVPAIGYVVDNLNLRGTGFAAAMLSTNKTLMKQCFYENDIVSPAFEIVSCLEDLKIAAKKIGYPLMVKAVDSSGSRGVSQVLLECDLELAYESALEVSKSNEVLVEKFLDGYEIGAQVLVVGLDVIEIVLHGDEVTPPPVSVPVGHALPIKIDKDLELKIKELITQAVTALGLKDTVSNVDVMIVDDQPYILEIGARMGATCLPENIMIYTGIDMYDFIINLSLGLNVKFPDRYDEQANASLLLRSNKTGTVKSIYIPEELNNNPNILDLSVDVNIGDEIKEFKVGPDRIGQIIVKGDTANEAINLAHKLASKINIEVCN